MTCLASIQTPGHCNRLRTPRSRMRPFRFDRALALLMFFFVSFSAGIVSGVAQAAGVVLVGNQTVITTADTNAAGQAEAFRTTAGASGAIASISVYIDASSAARTLVLGIYTDKSGTPGTLLTQGQLAGPVAGWNTVSVPSANVTAGSVYWIAVLSPAGAGKITLRDVGSAGIRSEGSSQTNLTTLPSTWSTGQVWQSSPASVYASATATQTPILSVSPASIVFTAVASGADPAPASLTVTNTGGGALILLWDDRSVLVVALSNERWRAALTIPNGFGEARQSRGGILYGQCHNRRAGRERLASRCSRNLYSNASVAAAADRQRLADLRA